MLFRSLGSTTAAYDTLIAEREQWAEQARSLEASEAEVARLRGKVAELEGSGAAPSGEESRRAAALEARNQQMDSEVAALRLKAKELEESGRCSRMKLTRPLPGAPDVVVSKPRHRGKHTPWFVHGWGVESLAVRSRRRAPSSRDRQNT